MFDAPCISRRACAQDDVAAASATWPSPGWPPEQAAAAAVRNPLAAEDAALPAAGQARHLPVHARRPDPRRYLRLQAAARRIDGKTCRRRRARGRQPAALALEVPASTARAACRSPSCSRNLAQHADDLCLLNSMHTDVPEPSAVVPDAAHRRVPLHPARRWARGCSTAWAPRTRTCPASSPSARRPTWAAPRTTATPSCPPPTRARASATRARRSPGHASATSTNRSVRRPAAPAARPAADA